MQVQQSHIHKVIEKLITRSNLNSCISYKANVAFWEISLCSCMRRRDRLYVYLRSKLPALYHTKAAWVYFGGFWMWLPRLVRLPLRRSASYFSKQNISLYFLGGYPHNITSTFSTPLTLIYAMHFPFLRWENVHNSRTIPPQSDRTLCQITSRKRPFVFLVFRTPRHTKFGSSSLTPLIINNIELYFNIRAWVNHYISVSLNKWIWPKATGCPPCPRAAHAADVTGDQVYIFGGRHRSLRMNDLHCLDLNTMRWSGNLAIQSPEGLPEGRSWHSFKFVSHNKAIVYGGFNEKCQVLSDVWVLELPGLTWLQDKDSSSAGKRLWHSAAMPDLGEVHVHGGFRNNLLDLRQPRDHAEEMVCLRFSPPTLQRLVIERVCQNDLKQILEPQWKLLPLHLQHILNSRTSDTRLS
ncbi:unnamed protein product, partial [Meganyctiphanes norvegica]